MKFGFFSPYLNTFGGGERYMLTLASYLSKRHIVDIFWDDAQTKASLARFLKIDLTKTKFVPNIFKKSFVERSFATFSYNMIFIISDGSVPTSFASKNIIHFQVPFTTPRLDLKTKLKLKKYNYVVCNSFFTKEFIDKSYGVSSKVIYPPVDVKSIKPAEKENIIVSVGRFSQSQLHQKKQEILIEVFKEIYKKAQNWRLVLVGQLKKEDERYMRRLRKMARGHAIKIDENVSVEKLRQLYSHASIYWHATGFGEDEVKNPERMEHFGISTVEAQAAGAVPIVVGYGGQKEIVTDNKNGLLWTTKSQLYEKTLSLIENQKRRDELSQAAVKNSRRFSEGTFIREYEKIIF